MSWLVFATPHLLFHITQTDHFSARSNLEQLGGLGLAVVLPLFFTRRSGNTGRNLT